MKCSKCGFFSHDYLDECKKCHAPLKAKPIYKFLYESESDNQNADFAKELNTGLESEEQGKNLIGFRPPNQDLIDLQNDKDESDEYQEINSSEEFSIFDAPTLIENLPDDDYEAELDIDIEEIKGISDDFDLDNPAHENYDYTLPKGSSKINGISGFIYSVYDFITRKRNYSFRDLYDQDTIFKDYVPASIESRFLAALIDFFVLLLITTITFVFGVRIIGISPELDVPNVISVLIWLYASLFLLCSTYFVFFVYYSGQTIGKMVMNIKVIDEDGSEVGIFQSILRWFCYAVSILPLCLGLFWIIFDVKNQSFHDKIANTVVVRV